MDAVIGKAVEGVEPCRSNNMQGSFPKVVAQGLDSLWVTAWEPLRVNLAIALERAKEKAQARHCNTPGGERRPESLLFGVKGSSVVQVGAKVRGMIRPGRADPVLRAVWDANGYGGGDVYRVEARYFREFLRERGVETVPQLRA